MPTLRSHAKESSSCDPSFQCGVVSSPCPAPSSVAPTTPVQDHEGLTQKASPATPQRNGAQLALRRSRRLNTVDDGTLNGDVEMGTVCETIESGGLDTSVTIEADIPVVSSPLRCRGRGRGGRGRGRAGGRSRGRCQNGIVASCNMHVDAMPGKLAVDSILVLEDEGQRSLKAPRFPRAASKLDVMADESSPGSRLGLQEAEGEPSSKKTKSHKLRGAGTGYAEIEAKGKKKSVVMKLFETGVPGDAACSSSDRLETEGKTVGPLQQLLDDLEAELSQPFREGLDVGPSQPHLEGLEAGPSQPHPVELSQPFPEGLDVGPSQPHPEGLEAGPSQPHPVDFEARLLETGGLKCEVSNSNQHVSAGSDARRASFFAIARRRAAHFAHFDGQGNEPPSAPPGTHQRRRRRRDDDANVAIQPAVQNPPAEQEDWPGPFSTARRLVEGRAAAAAARQQAGKADLKVSLVDWQPSSIARDSSFIQRNLPSLYELCVRVLCNNVEHVESLYGVPESTKNRLCASLCERRKMDPNVFSLFFAGEPSEIRVPECSLVPELEFTQMMKECIANRLEVLELGNCGRGLSDQCLAAIVTSTPGSLLVSHTLALRGAYRLTDNGIGSIARVAPALNSLDLTDCSCLSESGIQAVADSVGLNLKSLVLDGCKQLHGSNLLPILLRMPQLQKLSLAHVAGLTDEIVSELVVQLGPGLKELSLAHCSSLTDAALAAIGACCFELKTLHLGFLHLLTDVTLGCIADGCRSLSNLSLTRCKFSDEAIAAYVTASGSLLSELSLNAVRQAADQTLLALAKHANSSLKLFDASWCRLMSDEGLGYLTDSCPNLCELRLYGCTQVTNKFLKGHSNLNLRVIGLWEGS